MWIDLLIILGAAAALYRGRHNGFVVQFLAIAGFFGGLFFGSWLQRHAVTLAGSTEAKALITVITTLGCGMVGLILGEYIAERIKHRFKNLRIDRVDTDLGGVLNVISLLISAWLIAALVTNLPSSSIRSTVQSSHIISALNRSLPPAPNVISNLGHLIDPNGFPDVFIGNEPIPRTQDLPSLGEMEAAVRQDEASVVRIRGLGCGGLVSGSGFVVGNGLVATNAHVVAGIRHPVVQDANGNHSASALWFDPNLDFAVLKVAGLAGKPLALTDRIADQGTPAAVLGYPGGGSFSAGPAAVIDEFKAYGRNIYGTDRTLRDIYEIQADIIPGNSGGPLVDKQGRVLGMIFAESTSYNHVGYSLTNSRLAGELKQAQAANRITDTGHCAD
jgi:S1-C subfamily serine protease